MFIIIWSGHSSTLFSFYKELLKKKLYCMSDSLVNDVINCVLDPLVHPAIFLV